MNRSKRSRKGSHLPELRDAPLAGLGDHPLGLSNGSERSRKGTSLSEQVATQSVSSWHQATVLHRLE